MKKSLIYLATPYSHDDPDIRQSRFDAVNLVAGDLMRAGFHIYSPISHTHPIAVAGDLPKGWDFWEPYDRAILSCCMAMIVLKQEGWDQSSGVRAEIDIARELSIPVFYMGMY